MNNQEYEQKKRECWEDFCDEHLFDPHNIITQGIFGYAFDRAYTLGKQAKDVKKPGCGQTIKGWAACDRDGMLRLHYDKPERTDGRYWQGGFKSSYLPTAVVLPIVWESTPIEVEVTIKQCFSSDVEEEDNPQARAWDALTPAMRTYCRNMRRTSHDGNVVDLLDRLFGPKCAPDGNPSNVDEIGKDCNVDSSEPKPAEPRFKVEDEVVWDKRIIAYVDEILNDGYYIIYSRAGNQYTVHESDLEPYTEPEEETSPNVDHSDIDIAELVAKGSFSKERRLNIAAMAMQGILSNADRMKQYGEIAMRESEGLTQLVARNAMRYAEALIAEAELTEKLKGE